MTKQNKPLRSARKPDTTEPKSPEQTGHTPGQWLQDEHFVYSLNDNHINRFAASIQGGYDDEGNRISEKEIAANACLIAAAPELLEACKELREAAAACFRVINGCGNEAVEDLEVECAAAGVREGFGLRAQLLIAKAQGVPGSGVPTSQKPTATKGKEKQVSFSPQAVGQLVEAAKNALEGSVDATTYPDGPCLSKGIRDALRSALAALGQLPED